VERSAVRHFSYQLLETITNSHKFQPDKHEDALYHPERAQVHVERRRDRRPARCCGDDRLKWNENTLRKCGSRNEIRFVRSYRTFAFRHLRPGPRSL